MDTTNGYPHPAEDDPLSSYPSTLAGLAGLLPRRGQATVVFTASASASVDVTLTLPANARIMLTPRATLYNVGITGQTSTGFTIGARTLDGGNRTENLAVDWLVVPA